MEIAGKVALVTGATNGRGKIISEHLLKNHAKVCIADAENEGFDDLEKTLSAAYGKPNVLFVKCEVTSAKQLEDAFAAAKKHFGRIDILVNAAGVFNENDPQKTIDVNLTGNIAATYKAFEHLGQKGEKFRGLVVNTASRIDMRGSFACPAYLATQYAICGLTRALGNEINFEETGVKVIYISSGHVASTESSDILKLCRHAHRIPEIFKDKDHDNISAEVFGALTLDAIAKAASGDCFSINHEGKLSTITFKDEV